MELGFDRRCFGTRDDKRVRGFRIDDVDVVNDESQDATRHSLRRAATAADPRARRTRSSRRQQRRDKYVIVRENGMPLAVRDRLGVDAPMSWRAISTDPSVGCRLVVGGFWAVDSP